MESQFIAADNYVAFTFFLGTMAMMAASVFFFYEAHHATPKWRLSILISGIITLIAAVHYYYMRGYNLEVTNLIRNGLAPENTSASPTFFRYVDWLLTVPLMCVEFFLITSKASSRNGTGVRLLWKLIAGAVAMLVTGYFGEAVYPQDSVWWGTASALAYFYIIYLVWFGEVAILANSSSPAVNQANKSLGWFVLAGWAIYPIGYIVGTPGGLFGIPADELGIGALNMDIVYNLGDGINKIGFGLTIYLLSIKDND